MTHNLEVPFLDYPGAGWCLYGSWSRLVRLMKDLFRDELTYDDVYGGGPKLSWSFERYSASDFPLAINGNLPILMLRPFLFASSSVRPILAT